MQVKFAWVPPVHDCTYPTQKHNPFDQNAQTSEVFVIAAYKEKKWGYVAAYRRSKKSRKEAPIFFGTDKTLHVGKDLSLDRADRLDASDTP